MSVGAHYILCLVGIIFYCIKEWCRSPGDGDCLGYGDRPKDGVVFCLHQTIYTLGVLWIKPAAAGLGQLCICTCNPCPGEDQDEGRANCLQPTAVIRADQEAR